MTGNAGIMDGGKRLAPILTVNDRHILIFGDREHLLVSGASDKTVRVWDSNP